jgi:dGTP triphosphohydrolase
MEWADNIAYSVHDLEDGMKAGMITQSLMDDSVFMSKVKREFEADGSSLDKADLEFVRQYMKEGCLHYHGLLRVEGSRVCSLCDSASFERSGSCSF